MLLVTKIVIMVIICVIVILCSVLCYLCIKRKKELSRQSLDDKTVSNSISNKNNLENDKSEKKIEIAILNEEGIKVGNVTKGKDIEIRMHKENYQSSMVQNISYYLDKAKKSISPQSSVEGNVKYDKLFNEREIDNDALTIGGIKQTKMENDFVKSQSINKNDEGIMKAGLSNTQMIIEEKDDNEDDK